MAGIVNLQAARRLQTGSRRPRSGYSAQVTEAAQIPSGTVTLLFTDIQGSTRLWEAEPGPMADALRRHDAILRGAIESASGFVFKTVGDAFCAAFATAPAAVEAALAAQRCLTAEDWLTSRPIRVRMGLHTGECEERDQDYFGPAVNRAARLEAVAHGGQVLVSGATAELLAGRVPLRDLGQHRLKDLGRPEQVFQLEADFLEATFPALASLDNPELPNNLPMLLSGFVGRAAELVEVRALAGSSRLVTLAGAGGSGKTRLALQAAAEQIGRSPDGVWLVELASLTDGTQIPGAVAAALGIAEHTGPTLTEKVTDALAGQDTLLVLDNCEHLIDAAAKFCDQVIRHCPRVRFLTTSREPLGIDGERIYRVPSMSLPPADVDAVGELSGSDAVQLFAERARMQLPAFAVDDVAVPLVVTICRRLDGIPLALELAAARLSSMSLRQVADRLDQRFRLLTGGARNAMPRQQTLQATVEWSFGLLAQRERDTLRRLSVFAGGFDLEAAEAVCTSASVDEFDVADLLGSLVDKSLVVADRSPDSVRYRLLETIRQYSAQELLRADGDEEVLRVRSRHADYFIGLAQLAAPALVGPKQVPWLRRFDREWDNLRATLAHLEAEARADDILRLTVSLVRFTLSRGNAEVLDYARPVVDRTDAAPSELLADGLAMTGALIKIIRRTDAAELAAARDYADRAVAMARAVGSPRAETRALSLLAESVDIGGDRATAFELSERAVSLARELGDVQFLGEQLQLLGYLTEAPEERRRIQLEALDCARRSGDVLLAGSELNHLFGLALQAGQIDEATTYLEEAIGLIEQVGGDLFVHLMRCNLVVWQLIQEQYAKAAPLVRTCLLMSRRLGAGVPSGELIFSAACVAGWAGDTERAARLHGAGDEDVRASLEMRTIFWSDAEQQLREREQGRLRELMGDTAFEAAYAAGAQLTLAQATDLALHRDSAA